jgi:hypothetical protein
MSGRHRKPPTRVPGRHRKPPGPSRWLAPGLVAVALLGAGGVGAHAALSDSGSGSNQAMPAILPTSASPSPGAVPAVSPASTPTPSAPPAKRRPAPALRLAITGSVSWIEVRRPTGRVLVSGLIRHGHRLTYRHGPLDVVIGNAGAVQVTRHGATHRAGRPGEVVTLSVE